MRVLQTDHKSKYDIFVQAMVELVSLVNSWSLQICSMLKNTCTIRKCSKQYTINNLVTSFHGFRTFYFRNDSSGHFEMFVKFAQFHFYKHGTHVNLNIYR